MKRITKKKRKESAFMMKTLRLVLRVSFASIALSLGLGVGVLWYYTKVIPDVKSILKHYEPSTVTTFYARDNSVIAEFFSEKRYIVPLESVPKHVMDAFVAAEDQHFYKHKGIDYWGIARALGRNVLAGEVVQGGSTITQQLTRSILRYRGRSYSRKIKEALLAFRIEKNLSKDEILYLYLNQIFLGHGAYGVEAAAQMYFHKSTPELTVAEGAFLAGLAPAPNTYSPYNNSEQGKNRQKYVLRRMVEDGYIPEAKATEAWQQPLPLYPQPSDTVYAAPYFVEQVRRHIESKYGAHALYSQGLKVYTTVELGAQEAAEGAVRRGLERLDKAEGYHGPLRKLTGPGEVEAYLTELFDRQSKLQPGDRAEGVVTAVIKSKRELRLDLGGRIATVRPDDYAWLAPGEGRSALRLFAVGDVLPLHIKKLSGEQEATVALDPEPGIQGSILATDVKTGEVRAMAGGYDYSKSQFNRATQAKRQPGSAFKPIIYAAALEKGFTASTMMYDTPVVLPFRLHDDEEMWKPRNFEKEFQGPTTFREGLIHSRNIVTVKILREIGVDAAIEFARRVGVSVDLDRNLSLALGSSALTSVELSLPYLVFASGGRRVEPTFIRAVYGRSGELLEGKDILHGKSVPKSIVQLGDQQYEVKEATGEQVMTPQIAYLTTHLMKEVIWFGTGHPVSVLGRPAAGKTGTTTDSRDAWFVGYTPQLLATVWVGHDDAHSMGGRATGTAYAAPIWLDFMQKALESEPVEEFTVPEGIVFVKIDADSGLRAIDSSRKVVYEAYLAGSEPQQYAPEPDQLDPNKFYENDLGF
ncbi:MAG: PBP1A family penicillin-binding protein [Nitrospirae bacterium]|nr:PBP1A family penicillin-binding protein [Nitrospirota bacterium]